MITCPKGHIVSRSAVGVEGTFECAECSKSSAPTAEERQLAERFHCKVADSGHWKFWSHANVYHILPDNVRDALLAAEREKQELRRVLQLALIPLAALVVSGECVDAPSALTALQSLPLFEHLDREFERLPLHSAHHIMLAMETIGFEHPDQEVARTAWMFYADSVRAQHLNPETRDQYESRYQDSPARKELAFS